MAKYLCVGCHQLYGEGPITNPKKAERGYCSFCWDVYLAQQRLNTALMMRNWRRR